MLYTAACKALGIRYPVAQAGMARWNTNAELAAAVGEAGGLGILGCLGRPADEARAQIERIRALTDRPFGVNLVLHLCEEDTFRACLEARAPVFSFFRGSPEQVVEATARAHDAGAVVVHQVTTPGEAVQACEAGVDVLVVQGTEAGGHMGPLPLSSLLPAVAAIAHEAGRPVLAAGGIVDGRGLAAALCLGADGVLMGTRFLATREAPISAAWKQAILDAAPGSTVASPAFDLIWGQDWPGVRARALRNGLAERWADTDSDTLLAARDEILDGIAQAERADDPEGMILLAGAGAGLIRDLQPAGDIVRDVVVTAVETLQEASRLIMSSEGLS